MSSLMEPTVLEESAISKNIAEKKNELTNLSIR